MTTDEMQSRYNHIGIGVIAGIVMFMAFSYGWFGMPPMDLVGSIGIGFGSGFSASVVSYIMMSRDE
jgi:hypothetical protein